MRPPLPTDPERSLLMRRIRRERTAPEERVAELLRTLGIAYRRNVSTLPGSPDFANKAKKWAIFVMGCYWHRHRNCKAGTVPTRNREFWTDKFATNRKRDARKIRALRKRGFRVLVVWECATKSADRLPVDRLATLRARPALAEDAGLGDTRPAD